MKHCFKKYIFFYIAAYFLLVPLKLYANTPSLNFPNELLPAINNLLDHMESPEKTPVNLDMMPEILDFVDKPKTVGETMSLGKRNGAVSDYYEFSVNGSLAKILDLTYNPDIPSNLTLPSSIRRSHWIVVNGKTKPLPRLSTELNNLDKPLIINGVEFIEISPDTFSGAYYAYNVDRLLILLKHKGRTALISVSNQQDKSEVGKKGIILGDDDEWNYIYSDEKGTTLPGTGWAKTYMYSSATISVFYESDTTPKQVKCAVFKWLNAGWLGVNFVKPAHIRNGMERYAKDFCKIIESPSLSNTTSLAQMFQKIHNLSKDELKSCTTACYNKIIDQFQNENKKNKKWFSKLFKKENYINELNRQEMEALIEIEYLKYKLGKPHRFDTSYFGVSPAKLESL